MPDKLAEAIAELISGIQEYESDTFSASARNIDEETARKMAAEFIVQCLLNTDGIEMAEIYERVTNEDN